jgi:CheY-like chemotaxis protein
MLILLCDDDALLRAVVGDQLRELGHQVELAADGMQALEQLKSKSFDAAILDFLMPKKSGLEVLKELNTWPKRPRVILLSAISPKTLPALKDAAADAVLEKPVKAKQLEKALTS